MEDEFTLTDDERVELFLKVLRPLKTSQIRRQITHDVWADPKRYSAVVAFVLAASQQPAE